MLRRIEGYSKQSVTKGTLPTIEEIVQRRESKLLGKVAIWLERGRSRREREMVEELVAAGNDPVEIAAAALKLARGEEAQRPIAPISEVQEARPRGAHRQDRFNRSDSRGNNRNDRGSERREDRRFSTDSREKGMVRLALNAGKAHGIRPGDIVGTLAFHANIPGHVIGAINIRQEHSLVDVPEQFVDKVLAKEGSYRIRKQPISVERA